MMTPSASEPSLCSSSRTSARENCWDKTEEVAPLTKLLATWLYDIKKKSVAGEKMTAPSDQSLCSSSQTCAREVYGWLTVCPPLVRMMEELAVSTRSPATELYYTNVVNYTAMVSGRSATYSLQQCRMEDHKKPYVLEEFDEFVGSAEEKFKLPLREMEDRKMSYLGIRVNPSSRQPRGRSVALCARQPRTQPPSQTHVSSSALPSADNRLQFPGVRAWASSDPRTRRSPRRLPRRSPRRSSRAASGAPVIKT